ncbi:MAG: TaqI-like C-terminal specificity domain-containing protein, partial [Bacteroidota bacterium]
TNNKWFETQDNIAYYPEFEKEKIVWQEMTNEGSFAWDTNKIYVNQTCYIMTNANKYILALLNSKIVHFYFSQISYALGIGAFRWIKQFVERLPIPKIPESEQQPFISLVDKMLELNQRLNQLGDKITDERGRIDEEIRKTDARIDELVYQIYNITPEERKIIEESLE